MWQQEVGGSINWEDAITYCEDLSLAGYSDWRLPNIKELRSIIDDNPYGPAIATNYFGYGHTYYWSSTTKASNTSYAWYVHFFAGHVGYRDKSLDHYVRCVRGGQ